MSYHFEEGCYEDYAERIENEIKFWQKCLDSANEFLRSIYPDFDIDPPEAMISKDGLFTKVMWLIAMNTRLNKTDEEICDLICHELTHYIWEQVFKEQPEHSVIYGYGIDASRIARKGKAGSLIGSQRWGDLIHYCSRIVEQVTGLQFKFDPILVVFDISAYIPKYDSGLVDNLVANDQHELLREAIKVNMRKFFWIKFNRMDKMKSEKFDAFVSVNLEKLEACIA